MAELITIARPYAKAAFEYAKAQDSFASWSNMLAALAYVASDTRVQAFINAPEYSDEERVQLFTDICSSVLSQEGINFVKLLAEKSRLGCLPAIHNLYEEHCAENNKIAQVEVTSANALGDKQKQSLQEKLKQRFGKQVVVSYNEDQALLGGLLIQAGDYVIDGTVRGRLQRMAEDLDVELT